jgi:CRP-like cAMP-binding protein
MSAAGRPLIEARRDQIFPTLAPEEIDRLRRFGEPRSYREGELLVRTGEPAPGLLVILAGEVAIAQRDDFAPHPPIFVHRPGSFLGELALDEKGFVRTGTDLGADRRPLETSRPGVFAIGDVRCGSVKRVAAAVGEGAQVVAALHAFLTRAAEPVAAVADPRRG